MIREMVWEGCRRDDKCFGLPGLDWFIHKSEAAVLIKDLKYKVEVHPCQIEP